jgi:hypothetical protein
MWREMELQEELEPQIMGVLSVTSVQNVRKMCTKYQDTVLRVIFSKKKFYINIVRLSTVMSIRTFECTYWP